MRLLAILVLSASSLLAQGNEDQHCDRQASTHCFTQRWPSTMSSSVVQYMPGKAWIDAKGFFALGSTTLNDSTATGYVVGKVDEYFTNQDNETRGFNANLTFNRTTIDEQTYGWDQFGISGVVIAGTLMNLPSDPIYGSRYIRGQQKAVNSELYYQTPLSSYTANIGMNYMASLSQVATGVTLNTWAGLLIPTPGEWGSGGHAVNGSGILIQDLHDAGNILTSATTAAIKIDGLNNFGRIQWQGGSLYPSSSGVLNYSGTNFNTAGSVTMNTTPADTAGFYMQMPASNPGGLTGLTGVIQYSCPGGVPGSGGCAPAVINIGHVHDVTLTGTLTTVNANISGTCTGSGCGGAPGVADIRSYGAVCDGTNQNTAVQAALTAGYTNLFIPAGCLWIAPSGIIPGNLNITGENWVTNGPISASIIASATNPTTLALQYGAGTSLTRLNLRGNSVNSPTNCPIGYTINASDRTQNVVSTCWSSFDGISGQDNTDRTGVFFKTGTFPNGQSGDAVNISNGYGIGYTGNSLRADNYSYHSGTAAIFASTMNVPVSAATYNAAPPAIIYAVNYTGAGYNPYMLALYDYNRTAGSMIQINHNTSTYTGAVFEADMAQGSGSFTGYYQIFTNNGSTKYSLDYAGGLIAGTVSAAGSISANTAHTNAAGFYVGTTGVIQYDSGSSTISVGNVYNVTAAGDIVTSDSAHHVGVGQAVVLGYPVFGAGAFLGFNAAVISGVYKGLLTGNRAGYLEFDNSGMRIKVTSGTQTANTTLSTVLSVLDSDTSANVTFGSGTTTTVSNLAINTTPNNNWGVSLQQNAYSGLGVGYLGIAHNLGYYAVGGVGAWRYPIGSTGGYVPFMFGTDGTSAHIYVAPISTGAVDSTVPSGPYSVLNAFPNGNISLGNGGTLTVLSTGLLTGSSSIQANTSHTNLAGFYMTDASGNPVGIIQCDGTGGYTDCPSFSIGNVKNVAAAGDFTTVDGHHFGIGLEGILSEAAGGDGVVVAFNAIPSTGTLYKALYSGAHSGYLEFDNGGFRLKTTSTSQTAGATLTSVIDVIDSDYLGNVTLNGSLFVRGAIEAINPTDPYTSFSSGSAPTSYSELQVITGAGGGSQSFMQMRANYGASPYIYMGYGGNTYTGMTGTVVGVFTCGGVSKTTLSFVGGVMVGCS